MECLNCPRLDHNNKKKVVNQTLFGFSLFHSVIMADQLNVAFGVQALYLPICSLICSSISLFIQYLLNVIMF